MKFESIERVAASAARAWEIYRDVERWHEWTASVTSVELLDGELRIGARVRVRQPRLPTAVWEVTELHERDGESYHFSWVSRAPGVRTTGIHLVESLGPDECRVTATLTQEGLLGRILGLVWTRLTRHYLAMETAGLKRRAEAAP